MRLFGRSRKHQQTTSARRRVLFVSHEATRTGAPKIILNILKHFQQNCDIQCESVLHTGGHLAEEFAEHSIVDCLNVPKSRNDDLKKRIHRVVHREKHNPPVLAICNSMESRFIANELASHGVPIISLIHELPSSYTEEDYESVYELAGKIVFPVHAVRDAADGKKPIPAGKSVVLSQGLLEPDFGKTIEPKQARAQIRRELGLPNDAFIVLGCGTLDLRKGIDHYAAVARKVVATNKSKTPIHFVWVGEGHRWPHSPYHYVKLDVDKSVAKNHVHFIGERACVEPYFAGSDVFLMSSRVDPFPCVIHEAMATGLPIIAFDNAGGAPEAIDNGAGFVVPYADYDQSASIINLLSGQPEVANGMRERSLERVHTRYRFEDYGEKLIDLSEELIEQRIRSTKILTRPRLAA